MRSSLLPALLAVIAVSSGCSDVPTAPPTGSPHLSQDLVEQAATPTAGCTYSSATTVATVSWSNLSVFTVRFASETDPNGPSYETELSHPTRSGTTTITASNLTIVKVFLYNRGGRLVADPTCVMID